MHISVSKNDMQPISRRLARLLPDQSAIADLTGILLEADEQSGSLRLVSTNLEVTLQYRVPATVFEGGRMMVNGKLLANMMPLLGEDNTVIRHQGESEARIENGKAYYEIMCLSGAHYPEPVTPAPEHTVRVRGLESMKGQTSFAAGRKAKSPTDVLVNAQLEVFPTEARMTCMDGNTLAIARNVWNALDSQPNTANAQFLIPIRSLSLLADVCGDEETVVGMSGSTLVLTGPDYTFSTRTMKGIYPDTNALLAQIKPAYDAIVSAQELWNDIDSASVVAETGSIVRLVSATMIKCKKVAVKKCRFLAVGNDI